MDGTDKTYKYDVAISFLHRDLSTAQEIRNGLPPSMPVFLFTERQKEIVGLGNGLEVFSSSFRFDSRLVIVLLRKGWGDTDWTNVEQRAIEERHLKDRSNFLIFIMLDDSEPPPWLPKTQILLDFSQYGVDAAIGAIKYRLQELGATIKVETLAERAARSAKVAEFKAETDHLWQCSEGVEQANQSALHYLAAIEKLAIDLSPTLHIEVGKDIRLVAFKTSRVSLSTAWSNPAINVLKGSSVPIWIWRRAIILPGSPFHYAGEPPRPDREIRCQPERVPDRGWCWKSPDDKKVRTSEELAEYAMRLFLDEVEGEGGNPKFQAFFV